MFFSDRIYPSKTMHSYFTKLRVDTTVGINLHNITQEISALIAQSEITDGIVVITSQHTTTAICLNEDEARLRIDIDNYLQQLAPADGPYLHNDIHLRDCPEDEPENAHSHLLAMLLGSSESIAIKDGRMQLGQWQSVMMIELDGPRSRDVSVQLMGH